MTLETIINLIKEFGTSIVAVWFFFYFTFLFWRIIVDYVKENILKKKDDNVKDPLEHKFFSNIEYFITTKIDTLRIYKEWRFCVWRTQIFKDMLKIKFTLRKEAMKQMILTKWDIEIVFMDWLLKLVKDYNYEWEKKLIPKVAIDKFNDWHNNHVQVFVLWIESIANWKCFSSDKEKINAIMELSSSMIVLTVLDGEKTLWLINGELTWVHYDIFILL